MKPSTASHDQAALVWNVISIALIAGLVAAIAIRMLA